MLRLADFQSARFFAGVTFAAMGLASPTLVHAQATTTYTYDALGRLTQSETTSTVTSNKPKTNITYDAAGNRVTYQTTGSPMKVIVVPLNGLTVIPIPNN